MPPAQLLADIDAGTLVRSLLIAAVIVVPYGVFKLRQVRAARAAAGIGATPAEVPAAPEPSGLEAVVARIAELSGAGGEVEVPDDCTVDGQPVDRTVVDLLVRNALDRSGLREVGRRAGPEGTVLELVPSGTGPADPGA